MLRYWLSLIVGIVIRWLFFQSTLKNVFEARIEISTPLNSWKRVTEGLYLEKQGVSPYYGDLFHEVPLALATYRFLVDSFGSYVQYVFIAADVASAVLLSITSCVFLDGIIRCEKKLKETALKASKSEDSRPDLSFLTLIFNESSVRNIPFFVFSVYLLCPFAILSCISQATTTLINLLMSILIFAFVTRCWITATIVVSILAHHSFYPVILLVPLALNVFKRDSLMKVLGVIWLFGALQGSLMYASFQVADKNWQFLNSTYGTVLTVPDLTPNIGLFWYFFTEMFEHFRSLFLWTFQINIFIYTIPLLLRFRSTPMLLLYALISIISIFKSYPCLGDYTIPMALLPMWKHNFQHMRQSFLVGCILGTTFLLAPLLWYLWIYAGSANSNFYFGITLAFNTAQIFLLTDLLFAACKRYYYLNYKQYLDEKGKPFRLDLK